MTHFFPPSIVIVWKAYFRAYSWSSRFTVLLGAARIKCHSIDVCIEKPAAIASKIVYGSLRAFRCVPATPAPTTHPLAPGMLDDVPCMKRASSFVSCRGRLHFGGADRTTFVRNPSTFDHCFAFPSDGCAQRRQPEPLQRPTPVAKFNVACESRTTRHETRTVCTYPLYWQPSWGPTPRPPVFTPRRHRRTSHELL